MEISKRLIKTVLKELHEEEKDIDLDIDLESEDSDDDYEDALEDILNYPLDDLEVLPKKVTDIIRPSAKAQTFLKEFKNALLEGFNSDEDIMAIADYYREDGVDVTTIINAMIGK
jgi:hypothetical protein